jgi:hypothetical protein
MHPLSHLVLPHNVLIDHDLRFENTEPAARCSSGIIHSLKVFTK